MDTYENFLKIVFQHIPESYFSTHKSKDLDSSILKNHQFITLMKDAPVVFGIFNLVKMGYEFLSPNMKNILGYESETVMGENGMEKVLSTFRPEHAHIHNTNIFPVFFSYIEKRASWHDISNYRFTTSFEVVKPDGSTGWFMQQITIIETDENGLALLAMVCISDISEIKRDNNVDFIIAEKKEDGAYSSVYAASYSSNASVIIFSERELEILLLIKEGKTSKEIGETLSISKHTVNNHRKNMLAKANLNTTVELIQMSRERRFI